MKQHRSSSRNSIRDISCLTIRGSIYLNRNCRVWCCSYDIALTCSRQFSTFTLRGGSNFVLHAWFICHMHPLLNLFHLFQYQCQFDLEDKDMRFIFETCVMKLSYIALKIDHSSEKHFTPRSGKNFKRLPSMRHIFVLECIRSSCYFANLAWSIFNLPIKGLSFCMQFFSIRWHRFHRLSYRYWRIEKTAFLSMNTTPCRKHMQI